MGDADLRADQAWPPAGTSADLAAAIVVFVAEHLRAAVGARGAIPQAAEVAPALLAGLPPTRDPGVGGRLRHVRGGRGRLELEASSSTSATRRRLPFGVSGALRCCIRVLLEVVGVNTHSLSAGPDLLHGVRNVVRHDT
jgi:hypothetical protein